MSADVQPLLKELDELIKRLTIPIERNLSKDGWTDESAAGIRTRLEIFRRAIELLGTMPPVAERPLNIVRALDHWGVHGGVLAEDLAAFEGELRRAS